MNCPNCGRLLPEALFGDIRFCPYCGEKLFEDGRYHIVEVQCGGRHDGDESIMMIFVDERQMYEVRPGESISFGVTSGFHTLKFRQKVRSKTITLLLGCDYVINAYFNSLSGLIETHIDKINGTENGFNKRELDEKMLTMPVMVSEDGQRSFDIMLGDDDPEFEINVTSGFKEGILRLYSERCEFSPKNNMKKEILHYKNIVAVRKKMGAVDLQCDGNVHIVYSIPKDIYNEVMAFLNNRISDVRSRDFGSF
jgi:hypothetical protein